MNTIHDFKVGDKVLFGRSQGEQTLGEVVRRGRTNLKVKQLEQRGTHRNYPVGTVWTVPPSLCTPTNRGPAEVYGGVTVTDFTPMPRRKSPRELLAERGIKRGDRVEFTFRGSRMTGRITRINVKRVTIEDISDSRYNGVYVNTSSIIRKVEDEAPVQRVNVRVGQAVAHPGLVHVPGEGMKDGTVKSVVTKVDQFSGTVEVYTRFKDTFKASEVTATTRTNDEIMEDIVSAYSGLEPEVLYCDGEASMAHVRAQSAKLNRALKALFTELGRTVSDGEAWSWHMAQREKAV